MECAPTKELHNLTATDLLLGILETYLLRLVRVSSITVSIATDSYKDAEIVRRASEKGRKTFKMFENVSVCIPIVHSVKKITNNANIIMFF